jgi:hypothetical protein
MVKFDKKLYMTEDDFYNRFNEMVLKEWEKLRIKLKEEREILKNFKNKGELEYV